MQSRPSFLISTGTAICGGSAIAAVGPVIGATEDEMSVSLGTIFLLNSVALLTFPAIGNSLHSRRRQFGLWAALAIHDTSSVVGASAKYGAVALAIGTTVKLARALWIVPVTVATAVAKGSKTRIQWPWFILFFCLAAVANTYLFPGSSLLSPAEQPGQADADLHAVPDRSNALACSAAEGRSASAAAGRVVVDHRRRSQPTGDSGRAGSRFDSPPGLRSRCQSPKKTLERESCSQPLWATKENPLNDAKSTRLRPPP